ncbi:MAG: DUF1992 domain-containing protein [Rhizobacter sp.]|nr:DUF1992 domain-containing protein [Rhizobacter sp.]
MPHPSDSERRKKRDALLRSQDEAIAEHLAQAMKSGELQSAESYGKPLADQDDYLRTPVEFRLPFKILKNAGVTPPEIDLFHKRAELRQQLEAATTDDERDTLKRRLGELELAIALRLEGMRVNGRL